MDRRVFQAIVVAFVAITLFLGGCGDSDETKGERLLGQAETLMQQDNELQAEQVLIDLIAKYPETQSRVAASNHLQRIQKQRALRKSERITKILDRYQQILDGYRAVYAEYPRSIAALDQSGYFFDSAYLEEVTPDGYKAYLWLKSDGSAYSVWCVALETGHGLVVETANRKGIPFEHDEALEKIKANFQASAWDGKLVALQEQN